MGPDTWSEKNDNVSNILDFGNKINAETRLARWLDVNAGLRCQVYAVTDKVYNFLEQRAAVSFGCYNVCGRKIRCTPKSRSHPTTATDSG